MNKDINLLMAETLIEFSKTVPNKLYEISLKIKQLEKNCNDTKIVDDLEDLKDKIDDIWKFSKSDKVKQIINNAQQLEADTIKDILTNVDFIKNEVLKNNENDIDLKKTKIQSWTRIGVQLIASAVAIGTLLVYIHINTKKIEKNVNQNIEKAILKSTKLK